MTDSAYSGPWPRIRRAILTRDHHICQLRLPGCTHVATQVDHIVSLLGGGPPRDPANLQAACRSCNVAKRNLERYHGIMSSLPSRDW